MESVKTSYLLELFDTSGEHKPIARFESNTPFVSVNLGDRFDDTGWDRLGGVGRIGSVDNPIMYKVHSIKHLILETDAGLLAKYCLNLEPHVGPASPVWGKSE